MSLSPKTEQYITDWAERRAKAEPYEAIVALNEHRCAYGHCRAQATDLVVIRIGGLDGWVYELRGVCLEHSTRFPLVDGVTSGIRPSYVTIRP